MGTLSINEFFEGIYQTQKVMFIYIVYNYTYIHSTNGSMPAEKEDNQLPIHESASVILSESDVPIDEVDLNCDDHPSDIEK